MYVASRVNNICFLAAPFLSLPPQGNLLHIAWTCSINKGAKVMLLYTPAQQHTLVFYMIFALIVCGDDEIALLNHLLTCAALDVSGYSVRFHMYFLTLPTTDFPKSSSFCLCSSFFFDSSSPWISLKQSSISG
jgi:hypothetical protein